MPRFGLPGVDSLRSLEAQGPRGILAAKSHLLLTLEGEGLGLQWASVRPGETAEGPSFLGDGREPEGPGLEEGREVGLLRGPLGEGCPWVLHGHSTAPRARRALGSPRPPVGQVLDALSWAGPGIPPRILQAPCHSGEGTHSGERLVLRTRKGGEKGEGSPGQRLGAGWSQGPTWGHGERWGLGAQRSSQGQMVA